MTHSPIKNSARTYGVILAGGEGTRFAPLSTPQRPKQFLNILGDRSLLQQTYDRLCQIIPPDRLYVMTNQRYVSLVAEHLPDLPERQIIGEPHKKNTGPSIVYITHLLHNIDPDAVAVILPADHCIKDEQCFTRQLTEAVEIARVTDRLVVFGVRPSWPAIGYGYIHCGACVAPSLPHTWVVDRFAEKPDQETAIRYVNAGDYYWNAGIFVGTTSLWLQELARHTPSSVAKLTDFTSSTQFRERFFDTTESVSIDIGLMEKSSRVAMCCADFGWNDIGSWESLRRLRDEGILISREAGESLDGLTSSPNSILPLPRRIEKPWGYEELWAQTANYVGKILHINRHQRLSYQYHRMKEETLRVLTGDVRITVESDGVERDVQLLPGDILHLPPLTKHRLQANEDSTVLEVSTAHLDDVVRVEDDYGRE